MPTRNAPGMNLHLQEISRSAAADVQVVLLLDNAGWHVRQALQVPANITWVPLPAYSPELNPMERVWLYLRAHYLANRVYADHDALYAAGCEAWNHFTAKPERVRSLCHSTWAESACSN